jgi:GNAT superfamily N-acetyltransferase
VHEEITAPSAVRNPQIYAYVTLMCSEVSLEGAHCLDDCASANSYETFPAVKIARFAVDTRIQGGGYGRALVSWGISVTKDRIMEHVGCRFLIADAKKSAVNCYKKTGFRMLDTKDNKNSAHPVMFLDINKL